ncbi:hypothetical protein Clacol_010520 [Clathrus columnatus]|uniref:Uncharacterized protein n=1 Tax=Clathrus columnatus TaxID=1419009 RepID=A0AAV5AU30_9AGAM|nr:hypothetical protein Clacol_010520 [Clathrus columnatus]
MNITILEESTSNLSASSLQCITNQVNQRTIWNIVWSSLTTILACTWISCHPNISFNKARQARKGLRERSGISNRKKSKEWWRTCWSDIEIMSKFKIIFVALIAPEFVVMWALRQYMAAKRIKEELIGGFVLSDQKGYPLCVLVFGTSHHTELNIDQELKDSIKSFVQDSIKVSLDDTSGFTKAVFRRSTGETLAVDAVVDALVEVAIDATVNATNDGKLLVPVGLTAALKAPKLKEAGVKTKKSTIETSVSDESEPESEEALGYLAEAGADEALICLANAVEGILSYFKNAVNMVNDEEANIIYDVGGLQATPAGLSFRFWDRLQDKLREKLWDRLWSRLRDRVRVTLGALKSCRDEEILDKSKRDWLAKAFAVAQTTWFVIQCIAREVQHLPLTEIELMTCAYALLSAVIYIFWWNKPFRVNFPIMVHSEIPHRPPELKLDTSKPNMWNVITLAKFLHGSVYDKTDFCRRVQVPTFYSGYFARHIEDLWNFRAEIVTAAIFGGIHLFAWNYEFPTRTELYLWRLSALVIVGAPPITFVPIWNLSRGMRGLHVHVSISKYSIAIIFLLYIIARFTILVLSIISLRKLPSGTFISVDWLAFIGHIE